MENSEIKIRQIGVPMPVDMADEFEMLCRERGQTMSGVIKMLVWHWLKKEKGDKE